MDTFIPNLMYVDENEQWQTLFYTNLPLTIKRLKECRREKAISLKEFSRGIRINADCLQEIESGESLMGPRWLDMISDFYNKPIEYFTCSTRNSDVQLSIFDFIEC